MTFSANAYRVRSSSSTSWAQAVNNAPDGAWINAREMKIRDVFADLRRETYEKALQMRLDATQAAFSPGGQGKRKAAAEQRP